MTNGSRSGAGRGNDRRPGGPGKKPFGPGKSTGFGRGGSGKSSGAGGGQEPGRPYGAGSGKPSGSGPGKPYGAGSGKSSGAGKPYGSGSGKSSGAGKSYGAGSGKSSGAGRSAATGKPFGAGKAGSKGQGRPQQGGAAKGSRPFGGERFGANLGPVARKRPPARPMERAPRDPDSTEGVRLQKVLANAGVASRRVCEEMITEGRVEVDGQVVTELGIRVDPQRVAIHVDGMRIQLNEDLKYFVFNKPRGVVSTMEDPEGRRCIADYVKNKKGERLFHVGRLDVNTEGLLLLTNDGELANRLTHPSYEIPKTYLVQVPGPMAQGVGAQMKQGLQLEDGWANVDSFRLVDSTPGKVLVEVVLHSGRNRIVRRLFDAVGHPVQRLVRTQFGPIRLGDQKQGSIRPLGQHEVGHLLAAVGL